jgi:hypothetical protein
MWYVVYNVVLMNNDTIVSVYDHSRQIQILYIYYSETTLLQRGQTSAGYQCLRLIIINKQLY